MLSCELHGLSASGALMGLSSEPRHEVAEETLLRDVMAGFLETTSVRDCHAMPCHAIGPPAGNAMQYNDCAVGCGHSRYLHDVMDR